MHENSLLAFEEQREAGHLSARQAEIYNAMFYLQTATDRQIMEHLKYTDMNAVRPRVTELVKQGKLFEAGSRLDSVTGKRVRIVAMRGSVAA